MRKSTNYGLKLMEGTDNVKRQDFVDNFEIIDREMKNNDTSMKEIANKVDNIKIADGTTTTKGIVKLNNSTTSTSQVEAATPLAVKTAYDKGNEALNKANQAFQYANNGKTTIANVIGNVSGNNTHAEIANRIQTDKNTAATNLSNKGVSASGNEALASLVGKIANISVEGMGGKRFVSGTINHVTGNDTKIHLNFSPGIIMIIQPGASYARYPLLCVTHVGGSFYPFQGESSSNYISYFDNNIVISKNCGTENFPYYAWEK